MDLPGYHECLVVDAAEDADERLLAWVRSGLQSHQRLLHIHDRDRAPALARLLGRHGIDVAELERAGQLTNLRPEDAYVVVDGAFHAEGQLARHRESVERALAEGWSGVRVSSEFLELGPGSGGLAERLEHERIAEQLSRAEPFWCLCVTTRTDAEDDLAVLVRAHPQAVSDRQMLVLGEPGLVTVRGEVDVANAALLGTHLETAVPVEGRLTIDLAGLRFIDLRGTRQFVFLARRLRGRVALELRNPPRQLIVLARVTNWAAELGLPVESGA